MAIKKDSKVRLVQPVIEGVVLQRRLNDEDNTEVLVEWSSGGETQQRWFLESELEEVAQ